MRIKSLEIKNFTSAPDGIYDLDRLNVFVGENGKGKSSILRALRYVLTGNLPTDPVRHGEVSLSVVAVIDDGQDTRIERQYFLPDTFRINGAEVKEKAFLAEVAKYKEEYEGYGISARYGSNIAFIKSEEPTIWEFLLTGKTDGKRIVGAKTLSVEMPDGTEFYVFRSHASICKVDGKTVTAKALGELIADRMQGSVKALDLVTSSEVLSAMQMPDFSKYLISILPVQVDFETLAERTNLSSEEREILEPLFPAAPAPISISDVREAYKIVFGVRTELGRKMDEWLSRSKFDGELPEQTAVQLQEEMDKANQQIGAVKQLQAAWVAYERQVAERNRAIETYQKWVTEYNSMGSIQQPDPNAQTALVEEENSIRKATETDARNIARLQQTNTPLQQMLANLNSTICPLCNKLVCSTDKTQVKNELQNIIRNNDQMMSEANARIAANNSKLEENRAKQETQRNIQNKYNEKVSLYNRIMELKKTIPAEPVKPQPVPDVSGLEEQVKNLALQLKVISVYEESRKAAAKYEEVKKQFTLYNAVVKATEPKKGALTTMIISILLDPFMEQINGFARSIRDDITIEFRMDDEGKGLQVYCKAHGREQFSSIKALSNGEKMIVVMALMDLVSNISNSRMMVFDNLESLDTGNLESMFAFLSGDGIAEQYDSILLAMVSHESAMKLLEKNKNNTKIYNL